MKNRHLVLVMLDTADDVDLERLTAKLDLAVDWVQAMPNAWLLWTTSSSQKWLDRIKSLIREDARILITEINPADRALRLSRPVSNFIRSKSFELEKAGERA